MPTVLKSGSLKLYQNCFTFFLFSEAHNVANIMVDEKFASHKYFSPKTWGEKQFWRPIPYLNSSGAWSKLRISA